MALKPSKKGIQADDVGFRSWSMYCELLRSCAVPGEMDDVGIAGFPAVRSLAPPPGSPGFRRRASVREYGLGQFPRYCRKLTAA